MLSFIVTGLDISDVYRKKAIEQLKNLTEIEGLIPYIIGDTVKDLKNRGITHWNIGEDKFYDLAMHLKEKAFTDFVDWCERSGVNTDKVVCIFDKGYCDFTEDIEADKIAGYLNKALELSYNKRCGTCRNEIITGVIYFTETLTGIAKQEDTLLYQHYNKYCNTKFIDSDGLDNYYIETIPMLTVEDEKNITSRINDFFIDRVSEVYQSLSVVKHKYLIDRPAQSVLNNFKEELYIDFAATDNGYLKREENVSTAEVSYFLIIYRGSRIMELPLTKQEYDERVKNITGHILHKTVCRNSRDGKVISIELLNHIGSKRALLNIELESSLIDLEIPEGVKIRRDVTDDFKYTDRAMVRRLPADI